MKTFAYEAFGILEVCQLAVVVPSECPDRLAIQVYSCYIYHSDSSVFVCTLGFLLPLARLRCFFLLASTNSKYSLGLISSSLMSGENTSSSSSMRSTRIKESKQLISPFSILFNVVCTLPWSYLRLLGCKYNNNSSNYVYFALIIFSLTKVYYLIRSLILHPYDIGKSIKKVTIQRVR